MVIGLLTNTFFRETYNLYAPTIVQQNMRSNHVLHCLIAENLDSV